MATETQTRPLDLETLAKLDFPIVTYEVSREKIREYAEAIGDRNPLHNDPVAARAAGARDVIAPPTFAAVFTTRPFRIALLDREWVARSTIDPARILHAEQRFEFRRPVHPGDRLLIQAIVDEVLPKERMVLLKIATRVDDEEGERVLDAITTLALRK